MNNPSLTVNELKKTYDGEHYAVNGITFSVYPGEIYGLLGSNGAGKTTTIKMIVGLSQPTEGTVVVNGIDISMDPVTAKKQLFFVPDTPLLFERLTGLEYLRFIADIYEISGFKRTEQIEGYIKGFNMTNVLSKRISEYSHGTRQKLLLCAAFMVNPSLIVLDEPVIGLDAYSIVFLKQSLKQFSDRGGTVIFSTHLMFLAEQLCDRLAVISQGKFIAEGTMEELHNQSGEYGMDLETIFLELTKDEISN